ncbi:rhythmically expressed gene 2 protein-like isoform X2 [Procambarus clarkii]|uniref:rhythmically expressed gene 2 protein-like isoform X2 n=1 Tax=Procambarus clarkii TaxID=6728 RepID=UPI001E6761E3|nr:rhythmically expressed gene 2 protein-like isoform X2 [Procambarus clarkii]XP_045613020.1 rhythmically expressed gene 2 protein-like isoform X2 [Procambarus clarkii]XP_045613028.1 rhythmically expressed gene 2 protein-like isoform X2 [Procambarus clarkii]
MLRLITLDVTNTILKFRNSPGEQYAAIGQLYGLNPDPQKLKHAFGLSYRKLEKETPNFGAGSIGWQNWWLLIVRETFKRADCHAEEHTLNAVGHHLIKHFASANAYELLDGCIPLLEQINDKAVKIGAISNFDYRLEGILYQLGIRHYFDFVVNSYSVKAAKPDPRIFQQALVIAGSDISPGEALHIGDDLHRDYLGARASGWQSFLVSKDYRQLCEEVGVTPDTTSMFTCLRELLPVIERYTYP